MRRIVLALIFCAIMTSTVLAEVPKVMIPKVNQKIFVDGRLREEVWKKAAIFTLFKNVVTQNLADSKSNVFMMYDEQNLYIGFKFYESDITGVRALQNNHDRDVPVFLDDSIELYLDLQNDGEDPYFHVVINANGAVYDEIGLNNPEWDLEFQFATCRVEEESLWNVEMMIPFSSLGTTAPAVGTTWGLNLNRNRYRATPPFREHSAWALTPHGFHQPVMFGQLIFGEAVYSVK